MTHDKVNRRKMWHLWKWKEEKTSVAKLKTIVMKEKVHKSEN